MSGGIRWQGPTPAEISTSLHDAAEEVPAVLTDAMAAVAKRLHDTFPAEALASLPRRGGLAKTVAAARLTVTTSGGDGPTPSAVIEAGVAGIDLSRIDAGDLRHPVYGSAPWVSQKVRAGIWRRAVDKALQPAEGDLDHGTQDVADSL